MAASLHSQRMMIAATSCATDRENFTLGAGVAVKLHKSLPAVTATAAHVVYASWGIDHSAKYTNIFARLDDAATPDFSCSVSKEWQTAKAADKSVTDIVLLNCSSGEVAQLLGARLQNLALLAGYQEPVLWQPLAFGGFVMPASIDRMFRSVVFPPRSRPSAASF